MTKSEYLFSLLGKRVLLLDGAMGTTIQKLNLPKEDFQLDGKEAALGCNDLLSLTRPEILFDIHYNYLKAGADIIETNTFSSNGISLEDYNLCDYVKDLNLASAEIARAAVEAIEAEDESRYAFVAGILGPTGKSASFSTSSDDLCERSATFDDFVTIYSEQVNALLDGNVDLFLVETMFDTLVIKAALYAIFTEMEKRNVEKPVMVSATFSDNSGRTLSAQNVEAFVSSLSSYPLFSLGLNCSTGIKEMLPLIDTLDEISPFPISAHPNAGFPDIDGNYQQSPTQFASLLAPCLQRGLLHIVGGCCGTTQEHIRALHNELEKHTVALREPKERTFTLSGLEAFRSPKNRDLIVVGERANVSGSRKFARLLKEHSWDKVLKIIKDQIALGADVVDLCVDDPLLEGTVEMRTLLRHALSDPEIARVPFMIDSSHWEVIVTALKEIQGRAIVNSISLKDGEELFLEKARFITKMGAAMVVMLFDERGQGDTFERKCEIAKRSYSLLIDNKICHPTSIIFDPNVLSIATGMEEHAQYGLDFLRATRWIKENYPQVKVSGGVSNLSFSFRGNTYIREAIHALFLELGKEYGLDMAIVNPQTQIEASTLSKREYEIIKESLLLEKHDSEKATQELIDLALDSQQKKITSRNHIISPDSLKNLSSEERLTYSLVKGDDSHLQEDLDHLESMEAVDIIEGPLMRGMSEVGALFQEGTLFLPQVVRSARVMKKAVELLQPRLDSSNSHEQKSVGTVVFATVKGDVHDIGKNIVSLVLSCNNFKVIDLGVMVPPQTILDAAIEHKADLVALSGLITPSLSQMAYVCSLFQSNNLTIPILIGGATTSELHTALKLEPLYPHLTFYGKDATQTVSIALHLLSKNRDSFIEEVGARYETLKEQRERKNRVVLPLHEAQMKRHQKREATLFSPKPYIQVVDTIQLEDLIPLINWEMFLKGWDVPRSSDEAKKVKKEAMELLQSKKVKEALNASIKAIFGLFPVKKLEDETIAILDEHGYVIHSMNFLRSQNPNASHQCLSLSDYIHDDSVDTMGMFVATSALTLSSLLSEFDKGNEIYDSLLLSTIGDSLAEALSEYLHKQIVHPMWTSLSTVSTIRPAIGYPSVPDHLMKRTIFETLHATDKIGVVLTDEMAMSPVSSVSGLYFADTECSYFSLSSISEEQFELYSSHINKERDEILHYMPIDIVKEKKE
jgi:5-methyltetrahydrofolate--homocysteine methyltransferase